MSTLLLDLTDWDLLADAAGNIAVATDPYAKAQDVGSALKLFLGEQWYQPQNGIPYFEDILGRAPGRGVFEDAMRRAALTVPGVVDAKCTIQLIENRRVDALVEFTDETGRQNQVRLS